MKIMCNNSTICNNSNKMKNSYNNKMKIICINKILYYKNKYKKMRILWNNKFNRNKKFCNNNNKMKILCNNNNNKISCNNNNKIS